MAFLKSRETRSGLSWRLQYRDGGKERVLTFTDEKQAKHWLGVFNSAGPAAAMKMMNDEIDRAVGVPTVREVVETHIDRLTGVTDGTRAEYRREAERDIYPTLGDLPITGLHDALPGWVNGLADRLSGKTIVNRHSLLSGAAATAVRQGWIADNPCRGMRLPRGLRTEMVCLTRPEFRAVRARLADRWHPLVNLLAGAGLRWGEATALQVGDVDLLNNRLHVRRAWKHRQREVGPPKSRAGLRVAAFGAPVADSIRPLVEGRSPTAWLFLSVRGNPIPPNSFHGWAWGPAVKAAVEAGELARKPRVHDLRHTYASWTLAAGVPIYVVQRQMGHESIQTTVDTYGHLMPDALVAAANAAAAALVD